MIIGHYEEKCNFQKTLCFFVISCSVLIWQTGMAEPISALDSEKGDRPKNGS